MDGMKARSGYLIAFDLDGTALTRGAKALTVRAEAALCRAHELGCTIAAATGRTTTIVPPAVRELPFLEYLITSNGARLAEARGGECFFSAELPCETVRELVASQRPRGAAFNLFFHGRAVLEREGVTYMAALVPEEERGKMSAEMNGNAEIIPDISVLLGPDTCGIEKLGCTYPTQEAMLDALASLSNREDIEAVRVMHNELEITAVGVHKGAALKILAEKLGLAPERVLAIGDSGNDVSMRKSVGTLVAMGNAVPELLSVADAVTGRVEEDGLAAFLEEWLKTI